MQIQEGDLSEDVLSFQELFRGFLTASDEKRT